MEVIVTIVSKLVSSLFRVTYTLLIGVIHLVSTMDVPVGRQTTKNKSKKLGETDVGNIQQNWEKKQTINFQVTHIPCGTVLF